MKLNKIKREEKIATLLTQRNRHVTLQAQQESCDAEEYQLLLEEAGPGSQEAGTVVAVFTLSGELTVEANAGNYTCIGINEVGVAMQVVTVEIESKYGCCWIWLLDLFVCV